MAKSSVKSKKGAWFVKKRGSYLPISTLGTLSYIPFLAFLVFSLWAVQQNTDNALGAVFDVFPYWISAGVVMHWLASTKS